MNKEINYPIQYAILELKKEGGWSVGYEDITQGFIVSKCYVVESNIVYQSDGSINTVHKVVFPFKNISHLDDSNQDIGEENIPSYDVCGRPYPVDIVTDLFDSYEEAKMIAEEKNEDYKHKLIKATIGASNKKEKFKLLKQEYEQRIELCNLFERLVLEATKDMKISEQLATDEQKSLVRILNPVRKQL